MQTDSPARRIRNFLKHAGFRLDSGAVALRLLAQGGSDRRFYRVRTDRGVFVVMSSPAFRYEIRAYLDVGAYLHACGAGVPEILAHDDEGQLVLLEDIGDDSLYAVLQRTKDAGQVMELYRQVLAALAALHMKATPGMHTCHYLRHRSFGYEALRWETDYFTECFLRRYCGMTIHREAALDEELHRLAAAVAAEPRCFMHRDFQSKNIHFKDGRVRIIDFQNATCGLRQYDLASLLKDPYAQLEARQQQDLLDFYLQELAGAWGCAVDAGAFTDMFHRAGLQRIMQALGAFAFLSMQKGKVEFLQYIPAGIAALREALAIVSDYPVLAGLATQAEELIRQGATARTGKACATGV